ncbi:MAG: MBL fold metallo-hydrolase [Candidatus Scalindua sp. AMX11]|nr:MAG: MBL fold metallo-hydrolase [Candidatus Scalindua sp.]NOG84046.1 MBL fold metallo-hydrolase [Planctomycetota bacterium]RZV67451.1 MAG: MBL fold metallo-hydrolase [Candidatus Scalindua sp. SCAELEC01]TDE63666.1 MAG: MBL fold metallo-hydrolase [Candidatus Scalindua sp. AMX11]
MKFKIHRGTKEIGGSCVEVWTKSTRILLDFGMPLVEKDGKEFDFRKYKTTKTNELVSKGVLPDIHGLYNNSSNLIDGVIISHPHQDHYGLANFINNDVQYYLGEATHKIIELNNLFTPQEIHLKNTNYFEKEKTFKIGDISVAPYWADHSAFDAYSLLIETNGKSLFYSGDFRSHGRKAKVFYWFTHNAPQNVDYLLLEGTTISRDNKPFKTEPEIESELTNLLKRQGKINLIYTSGQNIDRITSIYKACKRTGKIFIVDVYVAKVLKELSKYAGIPYPSDDFENLKVMFPYFTSRRLKNEGNEKVLYQFKKYKITKEEISKQSDKIVMIVSFCTEIPKRSNCSGLCMRGSSRKPCKMGIVRYNTFL